MKEPKKDKNKDEKDEKKPFEPRPAKCKENYEDKGVKVFKPEGFEPFIGTFASPYPILSDEEEKSN